MNHDACLRGVNTTKLSTGECPTGKYCTECRHPYQRCRVENELTGVSTCHCPESCPPVLSPVCGSDNNTYESLCHLYRHACLNNLPPKQLLPVHRGSCSREGLCGRGRSQPCLFGGVCRVRIEEKLMSHHQISYSGKFACDPPECLWSETPDDAEPAGDRWLLAVILSAAGGEFSAQVCGTDGVTYKSECHLRRRAFELRRDIRVSERSSCNPCRKVTCPHFGLCRVNSRGQPQCHCPTNCLYSPGETSVCGSDGRIHDSGCELRRTSCRTKQDIQILPIEMCGQGAAGRRRRGNKEKRSVDRGRQQHQHRLRHYRKRSFLIWRPITCFLFLGKLNFSFFFRLLAVYRCCRMLEEDVFRNRTGDLVFMLAFCGFFILLANCFLGSAFLAQSFLMSMIYLWCRNRWYRFINLHLIGQIAFPALFLPLIILLISMVLYKSACMANLLALGRADIIVPGRSCTSCWVSCWLPACSCRCGCRLNANPSQPFEISLGQVQLLGRPAVSGAAVAAAAADCGLGACSYRGQPGWRLLLTRGRTGGRMKKWEAEAAAATWRMTTRCPTLRRSPRHRPAAGAAHHRCRISAASVSGLRSAARAPCWEAAAAAVWPKEPPAGPIRSLATGVESREAAAGAAVAEAETEVAWPVQPVSAAVTGRNWPECTLSSDSCEEEDTDSISCCCTGVAVAASCSSRPACLPPPPPLSCSSTNSCPTSSRSKPSDDNNSSAVAVRGIVLDTVGRPEVRLDVEVEASSRSTSCRSCWPDEAASRRDRAPSDLSGRPSSAIRHADVCARRSAGSRVGKNSTAAVDSSLGTALRSSVVLPTPLVSRNPSAARRLCQCRLEATWRPTFFSTLNWLVYIGGFLNKMQQNSQRLFAHLIGATAGPGANSGANQSGQRARNCGLASGADVAAAEHYKPAGGQAGLSQVGVLCRRCFGELLLLLLLLLVLYRRRQNNGRLRPADIGGKSAAASAAVAQLGELLDDRAAAGEPRPAGRQGCGTRAPPAVLTGTRDVGRQRCGAARGCRRSADGAAAATPRPRRLRRRYRPRSPMLQGQKLLSAVQQAVQAGRQTDIKSVAESRRRNAGTAGLQQAERHKVKVALRHNDEAWTLLLLLLRQYRWPRARRPMPLPLAPLPPLRPEASDSESAAAAAAAAFAAAAGAAKKPAETEATLWASESSPPRSKSGSSWFTSVWRNATSPSAGVSSQVYRYPAAREKYTRLESQSRQQTAWPGKSLQQREPPGDGRERPGLSAAPANRPSELTAAQPAARRPGADARHGGARRISRTPTATAGESQTGGRWPRERGRAGGGAGPPPRVVNAAQRCQSRQLRLFLGQLARGSQVPLLIVQRQPVVALSLVGQADVAVGSAASFGQRTAAEIRHLLVDPAQARGRVRLCAGRARLNPIAIIAHLFSHPQLVGQAANRLLKVAASSVQAAHLAVGRGHPVQPLGLVSHNQPLLLADQRLLQAAAVPMTGGQASQGPLLPSQISNPLAQSQIAFVATNGAFPVAKRFSFAAFAVDSPTTWRQTVELGQLLLQGWLSGLLSQAEGLLEAPNCGTDIAQRQSIPILIDDAVERLIGCQGGCALRLGRRERPLIAEADCRQAEAAQPGAPSLGRFWWVLGSQLLPVLAQCPAPFNIEADRCIFVNTIQSFTWCEANRQCSSIGGELINSYGSLQQLPSMPSFQTGNGIWLGVTDMADERNASKEGWQTVFGRGQLPLNDSLWVNGDPNNKGGKQDCVATYKSSAKLVDLSCSKKRGFACEFAAAAPIAAQLTDQWKRTPFKRSSYNPSSEYCFTDLTNIDRAIECVAMAMRSKDSQHVLFNKKQKKCRLLHFTDAQVEEAIELSTNHLLLVVLGSQLLPVLAQCPAPFYIEAGRCIFVNPSQSFTWCEANRQCSAIGGELINSYNLLKLLPSMPSFQTGNKYWLGVTDLANERAASKEGWQTVLGKDKLPLDDSLWFAGDPNNKGGKQDCRLKAALNSSTSPALKTRIRVRVRCSCSDCGPTQRPVEANSVQARLKCVMANRDSQHVFNGKRNAALHYRCSGGKAIGSADWDRVRAMARSKDSQHVVQKKQKKSPGFTDAVEAIETSADWPFAAQLAKAQAQLAAGSPNAEQDRTARPLQQLSCPMPGLGLSPSQGSRRRPPLAHDLRSVGRSSTEPRAGVAIRQGRRLDDDRRLGRRRRDPEAAGRLVAEPGPGPPPGVARPDRVRVWPAVRCGTLAHCPALHSQIDAANAANFRSFKQRQVALMAEQSALPMSQISQGVNRCVALAKLQRATQLLFLMRQSFGEVALDEVGGAKIAVGAALAFLVAWRPVRSAQSAQHGGLQFQTARAQLQSAFQRCDGLRMLAEAFQLLADNGHEYECTVGQVQLAELLVDGRRQGAVNQSLNQCPIFRIFAKALAESRCSISKLAQTLQSHAFTVVRLRMSSRHEYRLNGDSRGRFSLKLADAATTVGVAIALLLEAELGLLFFFFFCSDLSLLLLPTRRRKRNENLVDVETEDDATDDKAGSTIAPLSSQEVAGPAAAASVDRVDQAKATGSGRAPQKCFRCLSTRHLADKCPFIKKACFKCGKLGHTAAACRRGAGVSGADSKPRVGAVQEAEDEDCSSLNTVPSVAAKVPPYLTKVLINGVSCQMEIDTGAAVSLISAKVYQDLLGGIPKLGGTTIRLRNYGGQPVNVLGQLSVTVEIPGNEKKLLPLVVVSGSGSSLIGRNWLSELTMDWRSIKELRERELPAQGNQQVEQLLQKYSAPAEAPAPAEVVLLIDSFNEGPVTAAQLMMGRPLRTLLDLVRPDVSAAVTRRQEAQKLQHDRRARARSFEEGDDVVVRDFTGQQKWLPASISRQTAPLSYECRLPDDRIVRRHADHVASAGVEPLTSGSTELPINDELRYESAEAEVPPLLPPTPPPPTQPPTAPPPPTQPPLPPTPQARRSQRNRKCPDRLTYKRQSPALPGILQGQSELPQFESGRAAVAKQHVIVWLHLQGFVDVLQE
uniref:Kazal-like domain-containing protein n=1 Tax=Macrostomum lignano TaxID=282301 RepID=A0A1I8GG86_9PLAT